MQLDNLFEVIKKTGQKPFLDFVELSTRNSISQNTGRYDYMSANGFVFEQFKSLEDAFDKKNKIEQKANKSKYEIKALENVNKTQYKDYKSFTDYLDEPRPKFQKIKDISKVLVENVKTLINLGGLFSNDRIIVTEDARGVFDFGLASLGLYRPVEFYSKSLYYDIITGNVENPNANLDFEIGIVNPDKVNKKVTGSITTFVFNYLGKNYECERRQKGTTKVFNTFSNECFLNSNSDGLIVTYYLNDKSKVYNGSGNTRLKYASSNKKSYLIYNKKDDSVKNVDIFMPVNFIGVTDAERGIALFPAYLVSASLEEFGIQCRISALRLGSDESTQITISIPVKDYNESSKESFNKVYGLLGLAESANDFFGFHKIISENEGIQAPPTNDLDTSFSNIEYDKQAYMDEIMQRYKNWAEVNKDKPFFNSKVINPNFQFAIASTSIGIGSNLDYDVILDNLHRIFFQFYYYMDFLAIEMISMRDFVKSVYKRITEDETFRKLYAVPSVKKEIMDIIRAYVITILVQKYKVVTGGSYSDSPEQIRKKEETFKQKIISLNEELNSI
jgi:hypothetical protein